MMHVDVWIFYRCDLNHYFISQTVPNVAETRVLVAQKAASVPREPVYAGRRVSKNRTSSLASYS